MCRPRQPQSARQRTGALLASYAQCARVQFQLRRAARRAMADTLNQLRAGTIQAPCVSSAACLARAVVRDQLQLTQTREQLRDLPLVLDPGASADRAVAESWALRDDAEHAERSVGQAHRRTTRERSAVIDAHLRWPRLRL